MTWPAVSAGPKEEGLEHLGSVMRILSESNSTNWVFTVGNHELYNFTRAELRDGVETPG
jgi:manganese-dependent ADP-ribose/CDP-alcohol diphosphatase